MACLVAGGEAVLHGEGVDVGFDGGAYLSASDHGHVVLEVVVVGASDVGFDVSVVGVHGHESGSEEVFVVADGVHRGEDGVFHLLVVLPGEDGHLLGCVEGLADFVFGLALFLHDSVAVGLAHGAVEDVVYLLLCEAEGVGCFLGAFLLFEEVGLHVAEVLGDGFFGILLHA